MYKNINIFLKKTWKGQTTPCSPPPFMLLYAICLSDEMQRLDDCVYVSTCYLDLPCEPCNLFAGIKIQGRCIQWYKIAFVVLLILAIILTILTLVLLVHTRKKLMSQHDKLRAKQTEKWSKIQQILNTQTVSKQRPPAATLPPKGV